MPVYLRSLKTGLLRFSLHPEVFCVCLKGAFSKKQWILKDQKCLAQLLNLDCYQKPFPCFLFGAKKQLLCMKKSKMNRYQSTKKQVYQVPCFKSTPKEVGFTINYVQIQWFSSGYKSTRDCPEFCNYVGSNHISYII